MSSGVVAQQLGTMLFMQPEHGPQLIGLPTRCWPLHNRVRSSAAEAAALVRQDSPHALMARAGLAVARLAVALAPHAQSVWVVAGPGNNGGDGLVAALHLHRAGWRVLVSLLGDAQTRPADAAWALQQAQEAGVDIQAGIAPSASLTHRPGLIIDALLGMGTTRAPQGALAQAIAHINASAACVLAVDVPSGLNVDTGACWGASVVRADATLSLLTLKPGLFTAQGRDQAGSVWLDTLGIDAGEPSAVLHGPTPRLARQHGSHKGSHGDVAVVAGAAGMTGAAWLTARAALAAGAGRIVVSLLTDEAQTPDLLHPELMQRPRWWQSGPALLSRHTVVCGCGGGMQVAAALPPLLAHAARLVLDADALNAVAHDAGLALQLRSRAGRALPTVLTPHPLEAARLLGLTAAQVQNDRLGAAQGLADAMRCTVLLKGSGSVVAAPDQTPLLNPTGNAALAGPGTGDVLAGWLAGCWAQQPQASSQVTAADAAWEHGHAADNFAGAPLGLPLRASQLIEALAAGR